MLSTLVISLLPYFWVNSSPIISCNDCWCVESSSLKKNLFGIPFVFPSFVGSFIAFTLSFYLSELFEPTSTCNYAMVFVLWKIYPYLNYPMVFHKNLQDIWYPNYQDKCTSLYCLYVYVFRFLHWHQNVSLYNTITL